MGRTILIFLTWTIHIFTLTETRKVLVTKIRFSSVPDPLTHNVTAVLDHDSEPVQDTPEYSDLNRKGTKHSGLSADANRPGRLTFGPQRPQFTSTENVSKSKAKNMNSNRKNKPVNNNMDVKLDPGWSETSDTWNEDGKRRANGKGRVPNPKIVGGSQSSPNGWPSEVSIQYYGMDGYWYHFCGGSLIHKEWVVTVAHCLVKLEDYMIRVVLGDYRLGTLDGREQIRLPSNILVHSYFNHPEWTKDIGMIKLQTPANLDNYVQTALLATADMEPFSREHECYVAGWGSIFGTQDNLVTPDYLQQTRMTVIGEQDCTRQLHIENIIIDSHICLGNDRASVCIGDSGSPLQCCVDGHWVLAGLASWIYDEDCKPAIPNGDSGSPLQCRVDGRWVLAGLASWIYDENCEPAIPNVFTRMSSFNGWCQSVMEQYRH